MKQIFASMGVPATLLLLLLTTVQAEEEEKKVLPKPFGLGVGTVYIGGRDTDKEGTEVALRILGQYINYKVLSGIATAQDADDYAKNYAKNFCIGSCPAKSRCEKGVCVCNHDQGKTQVFGKCFHNVSGIAGTGAYGASNSDDIKWRKPEVPPRPEYCWYRNEEKNGKKEIRPDMRNHPKCQKITHPNVFDDSTQFCNPGDHNFCLGKDINMYCSERTVFDPRPEIQQDRHVCGCRKEMKFDRKNMECRIFLDVDCSRETREGFTNKNNITEVLNGKKVLAEGETVSPAEVKQAFCIVLDDQVEDYNSHLVGAFAWTIWGIGAGSFFAICCGSICAACCCCKCCESIKAKIRSMDPRTHIRNMDQNTQLAALGAVAANEYMEGKNDRADQERIQAMQGGMPAGAPGYAPIPTGYPMGSTGYPMPPGHQGNGGYTPVPEGYGPAHQGYGQQPVYQQQPGPGYIPPAQGGMVGEVMNMAPELALAGGGALTGNKTMAGLGVIAAAEKWDGQEDKEDRLRAAAMNPPPPPMGYAGGPTYPTGQGMNLPPVGNYPRQNMG